MAMTLKCLCEGAAGGKLCQLVSLRWHGTFNPGTDFTLVEAELKYMDAMTGYSAPYGDFEVIIDGIDLPNWVANWGSIFVDYYAGRSMSYNGNDTTNITSSITQKYMCLDVITGEQEFFEQEAVGYSSDDGSCGTPYDWWGHITGGTGFIWFKHSGPLGCWDVGKHLKGGGFTPAPTIFNTSAALDPNQNPCLCPVDAVAPVRFGILSGKLPDGQTLNPATGCVEGVPTGKDPGVSPIVFVAWDSAGASAQVECDVIKQGCPDCTEDTGNWFF